MSITSFLFFSKSQLCPFDNVLLATGSDVTVVDVNVCDLLQLCHFTADTFDDNTFIHMSPLSETTPGTVSEHTRHVYIYYMIIDNCCRIITNVSSICINITNY